MYYKPRGTRGGKKSKSKKRNENLRRMNHLYDMFAHYPDRNYEMQVAPLYELFAEYPDANDPRDSRHFQNTYNRSYEKQMAPLYDLFEGYANNLRRSRHQNLNDMMGNNLRYKKVHRGTRAGSRKQKSRQDRLQI